MKRRLVINSLLDCSSRLLHCVSKVGKRVANKPIKPKVKACKMREAALLVPFIKF